MRRFQFFLAVILFIFPLSVGAAGEEGKFVASVDKNGVQRVEIIAGRYYFHPNYMVVKANVPVEINIRKEPEMVPHDFVLKAPEAGIDIFQSLSSEPSIIRFTALKPGKYLFYCDRKFLFFKSHKEQGMEGVLEVTP
ncbi:MAG: cupredoxin domain-containing protein [Nitrospirae bacterium]|nr:cupredoxin domain-containing protein [Nitrospirota bacterium]